MSIAQKKDNENSLQMCIRDSRYPNAPTSENQSFFFLFKTQWNILHAVPKVIIWYNEEPFMTGE